MQKCIKFVKGESVLLQLRAVFFLNFLLLLRRIIGSEVTVSVFSVICYLYQSSKPQEVARISDFLINA